MNIFKCTSVILFVIMPTDVFAAEDATAPCAPSMQAKIERSFSDANLIFEGEFDFESATYSLEKTTSEVVALMDVNIKIKKIMKGSLKENSIRTNIVIHRPKPIYSLNPLGNVTVKKFLEDSFLLEEKCSSAKISRSAYTKQKNDLLNSAMTGTPKNTYFFPEQAGDLDGPYRAVDVPLVEGNEYVIFLFDDFQQGGANIFGNIADIYPLETYSKMKQYLPKN